MAQNSAWRDDEDSRLRQPATLYDAVAGRVGYEGFLTEQYHTSKFRDTLSTTLTAVPPDEVLFRRQGAPVRYDEDDIYDAGRQLPAGVSLPESDLLKVIHAYVADFYDRSVDDNKSDVKSMDETALLAMGVLLEEAAAGALGPTGDLALVESPSEDDHLDTGHAIDHCVENRSKKSVLTRTFKRLKHQPAREAEEMSGDDVKVNKMHLGHD